VTRACALFQLYMPADDEPPSALWCLFAAFLPAVPFCCFLHPATLLWWFPPWVATFYLPLPPVIRSVPKNFVLSLIAVCHSMVAEGWTSRARMLIGTFFLGQLMNLVHQALWDAFEPILIGNPNHGRGRQEERPMPKREILDKDGRPLGPNSVLLPGTEVLVDGRRCVVGQRPGR